MSEALTIKLKPSPRVFEWCMLEGTSTHFGVLLITSGRVGIVGHDFQGFSPPEVYSWLFIKKCRHLYDASIIIHSAAHTCEAKLRLNILDGICNNEYLAQSFVGVRVEWNLVVRSKLRSITPVATKGHVILWSFVVLTWMDDPLQYGWERGLLHYEHASHPSNMNALKWYVTHVNYF